MIKFSDSMVWFSVKFCNRKSLSKITLSRNCLPPKFWLKIEFYDEVIKFGWKSRQKIDSVFNSLARTLINSAVRLQIKNIAIKFVRKII